MRPDALTEKRRELSQALGTIEERLAELGDLIAAAKEERMQLEEDERRIHKEMHQISEVLEQRRKEQITHAL